MKIARRLLTVVGLATILIGTPACEMQKAEVTTKKYGDKYLTDAQKDEQPEPANPAPPTYFEE